MTIIHPDDHHKYFDELKSKLYEAPLTIAELCCLRDLVEDQLKAERDQQGLFSIGHRERLNLRDQFFVLCQALELSAIGVGRPHPERHNGDVRWTITHRNKRVYAVLVLRGSDDTWDIEPLYITERKRSIMTPKELQDTRDFGNYCLTIALKTQKVDLEGLGGWKVAR